MAYKKKKVIDGRKWYRYNFFGKAEITVPEDGSVSDASIANISFAGLGVYSPVLIRKGKKITVKISFIDSNGKVQDENIAGKVDWVSKLGKSYLMGIFFDEELNAVKQPLLIKHLAWLINSYNFPQPYKDKRVSMLLLLKRNPYLVKIKIFSVTPLYDTCSWSIPDMFTLNAKVYPLP